MSYAEKRLNKRRVDEKFEVLILISKVWTEEGVVTERSMLDSSGVLFDSREKANEFFNNLNMQIRRK